MFHDARAGHVIVTKSLGFLSEDTDDDFERITHHYKDLEAPKDKRALVRATTVSSSEPFDKFKSRLISAQDLYLTIKAAYPYLQSLSVIC